MKKPTLETILEEISKDPFLVEVNKQLSDDEKKKVQGIVSHFAKNFILPLEELTRTATEDPEVKSEIRSILQAKEAKKQDAENK